MVLSTNSEIVNKLARFGYGCAVLCICVWVIVPDENSINEWFQLNGLPSAQNNNEIRKKNHFKVLLIIIIIFCNEQLF